MRLLPILLLLTTLAHARTFYLDPEVGSLNNDGSIEAPWPALAEVVGADLIAKSAEGPVQAGDTLLLLSGMHGKLLLRGYYNDLPITIMAGDEQTPILESVLLQSCRNWRLIGLHVSSEPYGYYLANKLLAVEGHGHHGPSSNVEIRDCHVYSTTEPWTTAADWLGKASHGIYLYADSLTATGNWITNVDMGFTAGGDHILAENNRIVNFSGDGMRMLGSHNTFRGNLIKNCYDVDDNHDDGIQSWTVGGLIVDHNRIEGNTIINTDDPDRPLNGPLQGIGCFDGPYNDWTVINNLVVVDHWHGITLFGANDSRIVNNTVLDPSPQQRPGGSWIQVGNQKDGTPSTNTLVANNVVNEMKVTTETMTNVVLSTREAYAENFVEAEGFDFRLLASSSLIDAGTSGPAPENDLTGNARGEGAPDIGAFEFDGTVATYSRMAPEALVVYPNPFSHRVVIEGARATDRYRLYDAVGRRLFSGTHAELDTLTPTLGRGIYQLVLIRRGEIRGVVTLIRR